VADVDAKVAAVRRDIAAAQAARAAAEHQYQVARAQAEAAARDLKEEFGVSSPEQARQLLAQLEAELDAECTTVREALARTGQGVSQ
jgi:F0F1-type ATP synthase membrane subunit b/b'